MGGIFILFLSNVALVIGTQQWLNSKHSAGGRISGGDKRLMSSLSLVSMLLTSFIVVDGNKKQKHYL